MKLDLKNNMVVITPSRGRPENIESLLQAFKDTNTKADLCVVVDLDDERLPEYQKIDGVEYLMSFAREGKGMAKPLNKAAAILLDSYRHLAFLGDDHRPRTEGWDSLMIQALDEMGCGLVYGNDLIQGERLATAVAMTRNIVVELDGMVPKNLQHLYLDNFWMKLGQDIGGLKYLGHVVIEHMHPLAGKAAWDAGYQEVNAGEMYEADSKAYIEYITSEEYDDLVKRLAR